ncbi:MAG: TolC family protein [Bacteroidota bacterium]
MRSIHRILPLFLLLFLKTVSAQEAQLTKERAIALVLENNFDIEVAKNQVVIAENNKSILNSGYLPTLAGNAGASYGRDDSTIEFPGQFQVDSTGEPIVDGDGNTVPRADVEIDKAESQLYNAGLTLNYTLFDGLGRRYNYKTLKEQYQLSQLQARETIENTIVQLFSIYFEVARLTENENVQHQALEISKERVKRATYAFEYGQNTKLDILNAQVDETNDSVNLLRTQQELANAKRDLNVVLNQDLNESFVVDTVVAFLPTLQIESYVGQSEANNVSLLQAEQNVLINAYDIEISKSGYLPTIGLTGSYGWNLNQSAASAFFPGTNNTTYSLGLGANLSWNLFDGGATNVRVRNAKIAYKNQEIRQKQIKIEVDRDILNALDTYETLLEVYKIQEQNVLTNQNNFDRSREQYQLGRITSIEFRDAQINLLNAQTNKNLAKYDAKLAELQLLQLTGQLLNVAF